MMDSSGNTLRVIYSEEGLMRDLQADSVLLIRHTTVVPAIKKLVYAHDIVSLNLDVLHKYGFEFQEPIWDLSSLSELSQVRRELLVYHRVDFDPEQQLELYGRKMAQLFRLVSLRLPEFRCNF